MILAFVFAALFGVSQPDVDVTKYSVACLKEAAVAEANAGADPAFRVLAKYTVLDACK
jgi:hypothetical protein